jgi:CRP-like cAMP-binding protein
MIVNTIRQEIFDMDTALDCMLSYLNHIMPIPNTEFDKLKIFRYRVFQRNEHFLKAGDPLTHIGFNVKGAFRYYYLDFEGKERNKYFVTGNDFVLSFISFIEQSPSLYSIEALENSEMLIAPVNEVYTLLEESLYWKNIFHSILEKTYIFKEKREAELLLYDAKTRYLRLINDYPDICDKIKLHHIASFLGIAPQSLSRIRSQISTN